MADTNHNGPTRREFDRLQAQVDLIMRGGTQHGKVLEERVQQVTIALNGQGQSLRSEIKDQGQSLRAEIRGVKNAVKDLEKSVDGDIRDVGTKVDERLASWTKFGWTLLGVLIITLIGVITTLATRIEG